MICFQRQPQRSGLQDAHDVFFTHDQDFLAIDPRLASDPDQARADPSLVEDELRELIDQAHARNLYVILDIVLNHTGDVFEYPGIGAIADWAEKYVSLEAGARKAAKPARARR